MNGDAAEVENLFGALPRTQSDRLNTRKLLSEYTIDQELIREWAPGIFLEGQSGTISLSESDSGRPDLSLLPCTCAFTSIMLALIQKCHESKRRHKEDDHHDSMHYVLSAIADRLVTNDRQLRRAIELIEWKPVSVLTLDEFESDLKMI